MDKEAENMKLNNIRLVHRKILNQDFIVILKVE